MDFERKVTFSEMDKPEVYKNTSEQIDTDFLYSTKPYQDIYITTLESSLILFSTLDTQLPDNLELTFLTRD